MNADLSFRFTITEFQGQPFIVIIDEMGKRSVTRNIKAVVDVICMKEDINPVEHHIIYRDRRGVWDGYNFSTGQFIELREKDEYRAAIKLLQTV